MKTLWIEDEDALNVGRVVVTKTGTKDCVVCYSCDAIDDYETRLKADMVAMLTEIQLEFEENTVRWYVGRVDGKSDDVVLMETINDIIQQKINALKGEQNA